MHVQILFRWQMWKMSGRHDDFGATSLTTNQQCFCFNDPVEVEKTKKASKAKFINQAQHFIFKGALHQFHSTCKSQCTSHRDCSPTCENSSIIYSVTLEDCCTHIEIFQWHHLSISWVLKKCAMSKIAPYSARLVSASLFECPHSQCENLSRT